MAFKGITFAGQNVAPENDGGLYQAQYGDGILWGCSMAISGDDLVIQSGEFIAGGRVCFVDGATNVDLSGRGITTGYIQVIMNYDLSQGEGSQWYTSFVESASTTFPSLTQDNINNNDTLYQLALAIVQVSGGNLTGIYSSIEMSGVLTRGDIKIDPLSGDAYLKFQENGTTMGSLRYDTSNNRVTLNDVSGGSIRLLDSGVTQILANGQSIYLNPNGDDPTGQFSISPTGIVSAGGQITGGHPMVTNDDNTSVAVSADLSNWKNLASLTSLNIGGTYLVWGKASFKPSANTASNTNLAISSTSNGSSGGFNCSMWSANQNTQAVEVFALLTGYTTLYLNIQSGVGGTVTSRYFRAIRIN